MSYINLLDIKNHDYIDITEFDAKEIKDIAFDYCTKKEIYVVKEGEVLYYKLKDIYG